MKLGQLGLNSPRLSTGGRSFDSPSDAVSKPPMSSKPFGGGRSTSGGSSIVSATTGGGAPPVKNLGSKIINALRMRRKSMGAPRAGRRM